MGTAKLVLPDKNKYYKNPRSIARLVNYILAKGKTYTKDGETKEKVRYFDSNCVDIKNPLKGINQIKKIKEFYKNTDGRLMYHYILSFDESVKDPEKVYKIGLDIMFSFFNEHQTIFAVHEDTDNLHIHFVFNSVSYTTGKKWCLKDKEWYWLKYNIECKANSYFYDLQSLLE